MQKFVCMVVNNAKIIYSGICRLKARFQATFFNELEESLVPCRKQSISLMSQSCKGP